MSDNKSSYNGIGFCGALTIAFIILKLTSTIDWSWWWITAPSWIPVLISIPLIFVLAYLEAKDQKKQELQEAERRRTSSSKFQQRLQEAIDANKKVKDN